ncbi:MAG TPA: o-succinylbenzoate--CoA ligase [Dehalococcoidia bacterium]|nr:o-succinylbenzoate--CoA ligase [Dehalococcoidia bacterium]
MSGKPSLTTPDWLRQRAAASPARTAIVSREGTLSFADLDAAASGVAGRLRALGVKPGDHVALLAPNSAAFAKVVFGVMRAGAALVPLNTRLTDAELAWQLADSEPALLVAAGGAPIPPSRCALATLEEVSEAGGEAMGEAGQFDLDALHSIIYTSGTSGRPKGAMLTYGNHLWNALGSAANLGVRDDDRWLACMPLFHVGGLSILLRGVLYGMTVEVHEGFDAARVNEALSGGDVTIVSLVATMLRRMLAAHEGAYHPRLRCVLLGGGPAPADLVQECLRRGIPVAPTYGLTEAASQVSTLLPEEAAAKPGSAGKPLLTVVLSIVREDGSAAPAGEAGEIAVRGPTVMAGYWRRPEATAAALRDGSLRTGDYGYLDSEGYLYVADRRDDLIVTGGENVYPAEVEAVLEAHAAVREAGVFALPDREWGQRVAAAVVLEPGAEAGAEALRAWCRERLAGYKAPRTFVFLPELPRTASGKLLRRELRERHGG